MYIFMLNGETEGSTGFTAPRKLYRHPRPKRKGVYRFPRGSKSRRPQRFHRLSYSYTTSCCGLSGIHEAVIQLEAEAQPRLLIE